MSYQRMASIGPARSSRSPGSKRRASTLAGTFAFARNFWSTSAWFATIEPLIDGIFAIGSPPARRKPDLASARCSRTSEEFAAGLNLRVRAFRPAGGWLVRAASAAVVRAQPSRARLAREHEEVPVRDAAVHELREADHAGAVAAVVAPEIAPVDGPDRAERAVAVERPGELPEQDQPVAERGQHLALAGLLADLGAPMLELGVVLVDREIALE